MGNVFSALGYHTQNEGDHPNPDTTPSTASPSTTLPGPSTGLISNNPKYDVFISHAGEDKATIAVPLRDELMKHGITAFVDQADMQPGNDGPKAMTDAMGTTSVAVVVLSPEFVSRRWPMRELMHFLTRRSQSAADPPKPVIIPFFYRLKISELVDEPRLDRKNQSGGLLYLSEESKFYERRERGEIEADVDAIKSALMALRSITGVTNYLDASNDSSYLMSRRRNLLVQDLCEAVTRATPAGAVSMRSGSESSNDGPRQAPVDAFREFFPPLSSTAPAVLNFEKRGVLCEAFTPEGWVKHHLLERTSNSPCIVSIHGIAGVGKSTILRALSVDEQIRSRFPDGVHIITLGEDASISNFLRQICQVLKHAGAERAYQTLHMETDPDEILRFFETWFEGKSCAFFIDDAWERGIELGLLSRLCNIGSAGRNGVLITTREHEIASLAPSGKNVILRSRVARGFIARQILFLHAGHRETDHPIVSEENSINGILDICDGLPVILAVAGKNVKKMGIGLSTNKEGVWRRYLSQLMISRNKLLRKDVPTSWGTYKNLFATFATSISFLDEKPREETLGFASKFSFAQMHWRLCVLPKQGVVEIPSSMLKHLWQTESDEHADVIATAFAGSGLASLEVVRLKEECVSLLSLHDSLHDFASAEARRNDDIQEAHRCLLNGYKTTDPEISRDVRGTPQWWSQRLKPGGYNIHRNLCRHLLGAGHVMELVQLLLSPQWTERQVHINGMPTLEDDFALGVPAVPSLAVSDEERAEMETVLRLISEALNHSFPFVTYDIAELLFQVHGRLKKYEASYKAIQEYTSRIVMDGTKPLILCKTKFPGDTRGAHTKSISLNVGVHCMVLKKDGERAWCGSSNGLIFVVNAKQTLLQDFWDAHRHAVLAIALGRDETRLVSGSSDATVKVWEVETGRCVTSFEKHSRSVNGVAVMQDGRRVISVSDDGTAIVWDMETGQILTKPFAAHLGRQIKCVALLGDREDVVLTGGDDCNLRTWNATTRRQVGATFAFHALSVTCVGVTPDGRQVLSGSDDEIVKVWDAESHQQIRNALEGHTNDITCMAVSGDGHRLVTGSLDKTIRVWDLESRTEVCDPLNGHTKVVTGVSFLEGDDRIVSCSKDGTLRVWNVTEQKAELMTSGHEFPVSAVSFTPDGNFVVSGSRDNTLRIWDSTSGRQVGEPLEAYSYTTDLVFPPFPMDVAVTGDGRYILSVSSDGTLCVWDFGSHELLHILTGHTASVNSVAVTPQGDRAVTASQDKTIRVWNLTTMDGSHVVLNGQKPNRSHITGVKKVFVTDDGLRIVSVDDDLNIFVWELESKKLIKQFTKKADKWKLSRREILNLVGEATVHDDIPLSVAVDFRCSVVYGEGRDARVLATMESKVGSWALSPDKKTICIGLYDGQVALMELVT